MKIVTPEYATRQAKIKSGEVNPEECRFRWDKIPPKVDNFSTLDPWNADLEVGSIYTFRGVYNHHESLTAAQIEDPYDLTRGNYRYFVFDYVMEVVETSSGYPWAVGIDRNKTKWWKLNQIKYVTGTQDFVNGETVTKWMRDYQGRLYELNITVCTFDDNTAEVIGHGLATNSEGFEIVKTPLPCNPPITQTKDANYQPVRWYRPRLDGNKEYSEALGHIIGSEKHTLAREIGLIYKSFGEKKLGYAYQDGRKYMDKEGLEYWIQGYLKHLKDVRKGLSCESEDFEVKRSTAGKPVPVTFNVKTASLYADSVRIEGLNINIGKETYVGIIV